MKEIKVLQIWNNGTIKNLVHFEDWGTLFQFSSVSFNEIKTAISEQSFDIILFFTDGSLSCCPDVCKQIRNSFKNNITPIFILNPDFTTENMNECLNIFAVDIIKWPVSSDYLKLKILNLLEYRKEITKKVRSDITGNQNEDTFLRKVTETIHENIEDPDLNVSKLSRLIGISKNNLYRRIKKITGETVVNLIQNERLKVAAYLVENGNLNIAEIAFRTGFSSPSYFSRTFRIVYGKNPGYFRQNDSKKNISIST